MKWLQWAIDNAFTLIIIGGVLAQMLQAFMKKKGGGEAPTAGDQPREYEFEDPELAERTRKIREDIQRRIAQRQREGGAEEIPSPAEFEEPPPVIREVVVTAPEPPVKPARAATRLDAERQAEILEQQATWEAQLKEAKQLKESAAKRSEFERATADHSTAQRVAVRSTVLDDLKSPEALRRAFILREVLGPPVALRK